MKSERRHELQTNVLANWLAQQIEALKPHWQIIAGVLVGVVLVVVLIVVLSAPKPGNSAPWTSLFTAMQSPEAEETLLNVVTKNQGTKAGWYAKLAATDLEIQQGLRFVYQDRERAKELLEGALKDYQDVAENAGDPTIRRRATWGIAKTYEGLAAAWTEDTPDLKTKQTADIRKAAETYQKLAEEAKDSAVGREAQHNHDRLIGADGNVRPSVIELYESIAAFKPPQQSATPLDASDLPETPDLSFPGQFSINPEDADSGAGGAELNAPGATPGANTPAANAPAANTPSEGETPKDGDMPKSSEPSPEGATPKDDGAPKADDAPAPPSGDSQDSPPDVNKDAGKTEPGKKDDSGKSEEGAPAGDGASP